MFHKKINLYIVNQADEVKEMLVSKKFSENIEVTIVADKEIDIRNLQAADISIIETKNKSLSDIIDIFNDNHKENSVGILCAERKKLGLVIKLLDTKDIFNIWPTELNATEFEYYLDLLIRELNTQDELWLTKNYLDAAINSIPDMVWFKDKIGSHLKVNNAFCRAVDKTMEQIEGRGHYYIWNITADEYAKGEYICMESEYEVMDKKETCIFDEEVLIKKEVRKLKTYKTPLFDFDGTVMGTVGIAKDVTDELRYKHIADESTENDSLTGAKSRSYIYDFLEKREDPLAIYYIRLDNLYLVNMNRGYEKGDEVLSKTVTALRGLLEGTECEIARVGGSDFVVARYGSYMDAELKSSASVISEGLLAYYQTQLGLDEIKVLIGYNKSSNIVGCVEETIREAAKMVFSESIQ